MRQKSEMEFALYLIINANYLFLLKKINCFRLCDLEAGFAILLIKLEDFSKKKKYNSIIFICYNLLSENLK